AVPMRPFETQTGAAARKSLGQRQKPLARVAGTDCRRFAIVEVGLELRQTRQRGCKRGRQILSLSRRTKPGGSQIGLHAKATNPGQIAALGPVKHTAALDNIHAGVFDNNLDMPIETAQSFEDEECAQWKANWAVAAERSKDGKPQHFALRRIT